MSNTEIFLTVLGKKIIMFGYNNTMYNANIIETTYQYRLKWKFYILDDFEWNILVTLSYCHCHSNCPCYTLLVTILK